MVKTICEQCGDRGFSVALIYCDECQIAAVHRYCLAVMPEDFEEEVIWYCVDCEKKVAKQSSLDNLNSLPARNCDSRNLEIVQETQSEKNDINRLKKKKKKKKKKKLNRRDCIDSLAKAEVRQGEVSPCSHLDLHCNENHEKNKDQKFRRQRELGGSSTVEEAESLKTKTSVIAIGDSKNNLEHSSELHCGEGDKNNEKLERQIELDGSSSDKEIVSGKGKTSPLVTNDPTDILQHHCYDHKRSIIKVSCSENDKGGNNFKRQKLLVRDGSDEEIESVEPKSYLVATSNSLNIPTHSLAKAEVHQGEISPCSHLEMHCNENHEENKDQKFRRQRELGGSSTSEEAESVKTKTSVIAIADSKNNLEHSSELHCSEGDKNNEKLERQIELDGRSSDKEIVSGKGKTSPVVTNDPTDIQQHRCYDHKRSIIKVNCSENDKGDNNFKRQKLLVRDGSDEEMEFVEPKSCLVATSNSLNIPTESSNARAESIIEVHCNQNDENARRSGRQKGIEQGSPNEEAESSKHETSLVGTSVPSNINHSIYVPAQPIFQPIWNGSLYLSNEKYGTVRGLAAHLSTMASSRVFEEAKRFPELLCLELLPRSDVWPNNFIKRGPSDDNIALYLFPNNDRDGKVYNSLVDDMVSQNLAMRAVLENAELLVFTSNVLPFQFWRFESKFYMWGVFRGKQASRVQATQFAHAITWYPESPVSPLSHSEKNGINILKKKLQSTDCIGSLAKAEVRQGEISPCGQHELLFSNSLQGRQARTEVIEAFMKLKMKAGESVTDHIMKVIKYLDEARLLGAKIDHQTQMDMIMNTLSDSFAQFKINYELNKKEYTLTGLMNGLQVAKNILLKKKHDESNIAEATFFGYVPKSFKKVKRRRQKGKKKGNLAPPKKNTKKEANLKGKCFHCGVLGHWKRNCQVYLAQKKSDKGVPGDQKLE